VAGLPAKCAAHHFINRFMKMKVWCFILFFAAFGLQASACDQSGSFSDSLRVRMYTKGNTIRVSNNSACNGSLSIRARSATELHFYVFDLSGTLMHRATINDKAKTKIPPLEKGTYLFDVFRDDLSIEEGKIVIK
jgi:hypothetical protein